MEQQDQQPQEQQEQQEKVYQVSLTVNVRAANPLNATLVFGQVMGQAGADKFTVTDETGKTYNVDFGLLQELGLFNQPAEAVEAPAEMVEEKSEE